MIAYIKIFVKVRFFLLFLVFNATLLHLPPLRLHCVVGCWDQIQDICDFSNGFQTLDLTTGILYVVLIHSSIPSRRLINKLSSSFCCISPLGSINLCAADFSLLNLPKGKSLGRSKPATNS